MRRPVAVNVERDETRMKLVFKKLECNEECVKSDLLPLQPDILVLNLIIYRHTEQTN